MSYPGRPQMVPGMPVPPPGMSMQFMGMGGPPPLMPAMMQSHMIGPPMPSMPPGNPPMRGQYRGPTTTAPPTVGRNQVYNKRMSEQGSGPAVTVFVGNITERAPDAMIRHILAACGQVVSWKRVTGTTGRAPAFGFCEYASPDSGLRAVRLLHDLDLGGKTLVVKVDAKTKVVLDEFKDEKRRKLGSQKDAAGNASPLQDERPPPADEDSTDYMDDEMKNVDQSTMDRIKSIVADYDSDMKNYNPPAGDKERKMSKAQEKLLKLSHGGEGGVGGDSTPNFDDGEMEEGKRDLITREIGKFREIMKKQEEEKEAERRRKEAKDKERQKEPRSPGHRRRERTRSPGSPVTRNQSRSPPPLPRSTRHVSASPPPLPSSRSRPQPPSRSPSPESTYSNKLRSKGRDWRRSHSRSRERDEAPAKRSEREIQKEREMEEEAKDRKKQERKAREKEAAYQERLRNWEGRERRKAKEHAKEKEKERRTQEEQAREARRLKEFLEDYDDERDDAKFYKSRELARRLQLREQEIESDARDRQREKEELEEIRNKVYSDKGCDNPSAEFERIKLEREQQYKPKILVKVEIKPGDMTTRPASPPPQNINTHSNSSMSGISVPPPPSLSSPWRPPPEDNSTSALASPPPPPSLSSIPPPAAANAEDDSQLSAVSQASMPAMDDSISPLPPSSRGFSGWKSPPSQDNSLPSLPPRSSPSVPVPAPAPGQGVSIPVGKKRKLEIREVFNTEDDEDGSLGSGGGRKRKPLVPLDYGEDKTKKKELDTGSKASQEEKRKHIKTLIDTIPTDKEALFAFPIDWEAVDSVLMERRIRPWINKKIIEYIGEPEPTLVDFICSKVLVGSPPQGILDDVQMVLDEEAEVFVVKMWRLLIYEIEAKKLGLVK